MFSIFLGWTTMCKKNSSVPAECFPAKVRNFDYSSLMVWTQTKEKEICFFSGIVANQCYDYKTGCTLTHRCSKINTFPPVLKTNS